MSSRTTTAITAVLFLTAIATLYTYWTRTPQYTLLHVLNAYATADYRAAAAYVQNEPALKKKLQVQRRAENLIQHLAGLKMTVRPKTKGRALFDDPEYEEPTE